MMDDRVFLKNAGVILMFLSTYSPDFNPIEKKWVNLKRWLRDNILRYELLEVDIYECLGSK
jgi:transposase